MPRRRASPPRHTTAAASFPRRSRLSIQTADLHLRLRGRSGDGEAEEERGRGEREDGNGDGDGDGEGEGGGFSPESFKQRLLRGRVTGV